MTNSALHQHFPVVPEPIREYIEEVKGQLQDIARCPGGCGVGGWVGGWGQGCGQVGEVQGQQQEDVPWSGGACCP